MLNYAVNRPKWYTLTVFEQMGNIYSEVGRTMKAIRQGDDGHDAAMRALDLFDATAEQLSKQKSPRLQEVLRAREEFAAAFSNQVNANFDSYYLPFAIAARRLR